MFYHQGWRALDLGAWSGKARVHEGCWDLLDSTGFGSP